MAIQLKKKDVEEQTFCFKFGYCEVVNTIRLFERCGFYRTGYTSGVYGWNSDVYITLYGVAISSGYRPCGIRFPGLAAEIEQQAEKALDTQDCLIMQNTVNSIISRLCDLRWEYYGKESAKK